MSTFTWYPQGRRDMIAAQIDWESGPVAAVLLGDGYTYNSGHATYGDLSDENGDSDYSPVEVTGRVVDLDSEGRTVIQSGEVDFGDSVTIGGVKHMVFVYGDPAGLTSSDPLIAVQTFASKLSSSSSEFKIMAPAYWMRVEDA